MYQIPLDTNKGKKFIALFINKKSFEKLIIRNKRLKYYKNSEFRSFENGFIRILTFKIQLKMVNLITLG